MFVFRVHKINEFGTSNTVNGDSKQKKDKKKKERKQDEDKNGEAEDNQSENRLKLIFFCTLKLFLLHLQRKIQNIH